MKNFITILFILFFASAVGWYFMPEGWRGKIFSAVNAVRGDKQEIEKYFNELVLSPDPEKRRTVLLEELKTSLADAKKEGVDRSVSQNFIGMAEDIVKELEEVNHDKTFSREVAERVINKVFPVKDGAAECEDQN